MDSWALSGILPGGSLVAGFLGSLAGLGGGIVVIPFDARAGRRHPLRHRRIPRLRDRHLLGCRRRLRAGGLQQHPRSACSWRSPPRWARWAGAIIALHVPTAVIAVLFGLVLLHSAWLMFRAPRRWRAGWPRRLGDALEDERRLPQRRRVRAPTTCAPCRRLRPHGRSRGVLSGLLGIGSGALKVIAMDRVMKLPFKVSTTTSNFMIGVTAAASAGVYLSRGYIEPALALPVMLGVLGGSLVGAAAPGQGADAGAAHRLRADHRLPRVQMIYKGFTGRI